MVIVGEMPWQALRRVQFETKQPANGLEGLKYWKEDLLAGLAASFVATSVSIGIAIVFGAPSIASLVWHTVRSNRDCPNGFFKRLLDMFKNPVAERHVVLNKSRVCTNFIHVIRAIPNLPEHVKRTYIPIIDEIGIVDHTAADHLFDTIKLNNATSDSVIKIVGLKKPRRLANSHKSTMLLGIEREQMALAG